MNCAEQVGLRRGEGLSDQGRVTESAGDHRPDLLDQVQVGTCRSQPSNQGLGFRRGARGCSLPVYLLLSSPSFLLTTVLQLSSLGGGQKTSEGSLAGIRALASGEEARGVGTLGWLGRVARDSSGVSGAGAASVVWRI